METIEKKLQSPFLEEDIQWRVQQAGVSANSKAWVMVVPYVTNRAIQKRLDEVLGVLGWENTYKPTPDGKGYLCGITVHLDGKTVTKWDGAEYTNVEPLKGALSDSMKRTAVQLGIGRYLYQLDSSFADCHLIENRREATNVHTHYPNKQNKSIRQLIGWTPPILPIWAQPILDYSEFLIGIKSAKTITDLKTAFKAAYRASESNQDDRLLDEATKAKDARKLEIEEEELGKTNLLNDEINKWLLAEISTFGKLPTLATVTNYRDKLLSMLADRANSLPPSDKEEHIESLRKAAEARCKEINPQLAVS